MQSFSGHVANACLPVGSFIVHDVGLLLYKNQAAYHILGMIPIVERGKRGLLTSSKLASLELDNLEVDFNAVFCIQSVGNVKWRIVVLFFR